MVYTGDCYRDTSREATQYEGPWLGPGSQNDNVAGIEAVWSAPVVKFMEATVF